jgi:hypothetical protein
MSLNNAIQRFPPNLIATLFNFRPAAYFRIPEQELLAPQVNLR